MADNVTIDPGASPSAPIATDDVAGVHYQRVKLDVGADGASSPVVGALSVTHAAAASAALSNVATSTTAALGTGLGGIFRANAVAGAATDYIISSYQNTAATTAITGRNLYVRGVWVDAINVGAAVATTPTTWALALGYGHTALSLATAEAATTRAPRRVPLGAISFPVGAAIGATGDKSIYREFDVPIMVEPGAYFAVIGRCVAGTATASQVTNFYIGVDGYFE